MLSRLKIIRTVEKIVRYSFYLSTRTESYLLNFFDTDDGSDYCTPNEVACVELVLHGILVVVQSV